MSDFFFGGGGGAEHVQPVDAVRVFADGREEPLRGLELPALGSGMFREIVATGRAATATVYDPETRNAVTVTAPTILLGEAELVPSEDKGTKAPRLPSPLADK